MKLDKKLMILKYVRPLNIEEQKLLFIEQQGKYIPEFEYAEIALDLPEIKDQLKAIETPDIPGVELYQKKIQELLWRVKFLQAQKDQDTHIMTEMSEKLFGSIIPENFDRAKTYITDRENIEAEQEFLSFQEIKDYIKKFKHIYEIKIKVQETDMPSRFAMRGDTLLVRPNAKV
jgi:hypothetical protein